jgi:hypothetical protein
MADFQAMETNRSLQFEFKLLTKFSIFYRAQRCNTLCDGSHSTRLSNICASNPRLRSFCKKLKGGLHAGLESRSAAFETPKPKLRLFTGRFDYNQKFSITAAIIQLRVTGGNLKELLQKGGYRDFSQKKLLTTKRLYRVLLPTLPKQRKVLAPSTTLAD